MPILKMFWKDGYARYVEPFAGSACLFFELNPPKALLGDLNADLIALYRELKRQPAAVIGALAALPTFDKKKTFLEIRSSWNSDECPSNKAASFIYLNRFCFNGLFRTNMKGEFNVPYGGNKAGDLPPSRVLHDCARKLKGAALVAGDFEKVLNRVKDGDFVYMDPPFSVRKRRTFREYHPDAFSESDIVRLRRRLNRLADCKIPFLVSYAESDEADKLAKGFKKMNVSVRRHIAGFSAARARSREVLIYST